MTFKKALEYLENNEERLTAGRYVLVKTIAKICIGRQVPKTPDYEGDGYWDGELVHDTWICPNCGKDYEVEYEKYKHCPECGQAIDWRK